MIVNGETYACEGCIRGHRVRDCQHHDRPLQVVPKKGRPVSQCQHCRTMRKTRSAHIKCGCGRLTPAHMKPKESTDGDKERCYCHYGERCICAHKKQEPQLGKVPGPDFQMEPARGGPANLSYPLTWDADYYNQAPIHGIATTQSGISNFNYDPSLHNTSNLDRGSVHNDPRVNNWELRAPPLAVHGSYREQEGVTFETAAPGADESNTLSSARQLGTQPPLPNPSSMGMAPEDTSLELFGGLSSATNSADLDSISLSWTHYDDTSYWLPQPNPAHTATFNWEGAPDIGDFGTSDEMLRHSAGPLNVVLPEPPGPDIQ